jgi:predicted phosphodiesterase
VSAFIATPTPWGEHQAPAPFRATLIAGPELEKSRVSDVQLSTFAALGDLHAEDAALGAVLAFIRALSVERVLCVGDIVDGPGDLERCCALLESHDVSAVRGNHERWFRAGTMRTLPDAHQLADVSSTTAAFLSQLPATRSFQTPRGELLLCHGVGEDDMQCLTPDDFGYGLATNTALAGLLGEGRHRWMVGGHTHQRMVRTFEQLTVINAGTLCRDDEPCFVLVNLPEGFAQFYDVRALGQDIVAAERFAL